MNGSGVAVDGDDGGDGADFDWNSGGIDKVHLVDDFAGGGPAVRHGGVDPSDGESTGGRGIGQGKGGCRRAVGEGGGGGAEAVAPKGAVFAGLGELLLADAVDEGDVETVERARCLIPLAEGGRGGVGEGDGNGVAEDVVVQDFDVQGRGEGAIPGDGEVDLGGRDIEERRGFAVDEDLDAGGGWGKAFVEASNVALLVTAERSRP